MLLIYSCSSVSVYMLFVHCCFNLVSLLLLLFTVVHQLLLVCFVHLPLLCFVVRLPLCCSIQYCCWGLMHFWDKTFWKINLVDWEVISNTSSSCTLRADSTLFVKKIIFPESFTCEKIHPLIRKWTPGVPLMTQKLSWMLTQQNRWTKSLGKTKKNP